MLMKFKSQHEKNFTWPVAALFCGFLSVGSLNSYADVPHSHAQAVEQINEKMITGTILDDAGLPIVGANVTVKGTSKGTISDLDGVLNFLCLKIIQFWSFLLSDIRRLLCLWEPILL